MQIIFLFFAVLAKAFHFVVLADAASPAFLAVLLEIVMDANAAAFAQFAGTSLLLVSADPPALAVLAEVLLLSMAADAAAVACCAVTASFAMLAYVPASMASLQVPSIGFDSFSMEQIHALTFEKFEHVLEHKLLHGTRHRRQAVQEPKQLQNK